MVKTRWKVTAIVLFVAVFLSMIVLLIMQSVNNSRLLNYLLEYTVKDVTYSRSGELSMVCTTYGRVNDNVTPKDDGIALAADFGGDLDFVDKNSSLVKVTNNFAVNGRLEYELIGGAVELGSYENDNAGVELRRADNKQHVNLIIGSNYLDIVAGYNKGKIECGVVYEFCFVGHYFDLNLGWRDVDEVVCTFSLSTSMALPEPPVKLGYDFTGWYTDEACTQPYLDDKITGDVKLYAGFTPHCYEIRFNANSGIGVMENLSMTYDEYKDLPEVAFSKEHYAFTGWSTTAGGNVKYKDLQSVRNLSVKDGDVIDLFAVWERSEWLVSFDNDGEVTSQYVTANGQAELPETPSKEGYIFEGWYFVNGIEFTNQRITGDTVLKAKYSPIQCEVRFYVDGVLYGIYNCNYGTNVADLLKATGVNRVLYKVSPAYEVIETMVTAAVDVPLEKTSIGKVMDEETYKWVEPVVISIAVILIAVLVGTIIWKVTQK